MKNCPTHSRFRSSHAERPRVHLSVLTLTSALVLTGVSTSSHAVEFGRLRMLSGLGQPLRAEVELLNTGADQVQAGLAAVSPSAYRQKGLEYNPVLDSIRTSVQRNAAGRTVLVLSSESPVNTPFLDLALQASDGKASVARDFSLLLDNASANTGALSPVAPQVEDASQAESASETASTSTTTSKDDREKPALAAHTRNNRAQRSARSVQVQSGDTASAIALAAKPARVSLDQMLLALLRTNPDAFIDGNVNLLKRGAVLQMPDAAQARAIPAAQARQNIVAQSADFRSYRHKLAQTVVPQTTPDARQSSGSVQTDVQDTQATPDQAPDTLTLSKGAVAGKAEERIAQAAESKANASRTEELNKNLEDLKKLSSAAASAPASGAAQAGASAAASGSGIQITSPDAAAAQASAPSASGAGFLDALKQNAGLWGTAAALLALLTGWAAWKSHPRDNEDTDTPCTDHDAALPDHAAAPGTLLLPSLDLEDPHATATVMHMASPATDDPLQAAPSTASATDEPDMLVAADTVASVAPAQPTPPEVKEKLEGIVLDLNDMEAETENPDTPAPGDAGHRPLAFDMSAVSLDLDAAPASSDPSAQDGLSTKLGLAQEFLTIGDKEGARTMAEEVARHASGELQTQAQALLRSLG